MRWIHDLVLGLILALGTTSVVHGQEAGDELVRARHLEQVSGDFDGAVKLYERVAESEEQDVARRQEAALGVVRCLVATGRLQEATSLAGKALPGLTDAQNTVWHAEAQALFEGGFRGLGGAPGTKLQEVEWFDLMKMREDAVERLGEIVVPVLLEAAHEADAVKSRTWVAKTLQLLVRQLDRDTSGQIVGFFASLDPVGDPIRTLAALEALAEHTEQVPLQLHPLLDRCAQSSVPGIRVALVPLMARRDDGTGTEYLVSMLRALPPVRTPEDGALVGAILDHGMRHGDGQALAVTQAALEHPDEVVGVQAANRCWPGHRTAAWFAAAVHPRLGARAAALEEIQRIQGNRKGTTWSPLAELLAAEQIERLTAAFLETVQDAELEADRRASIAMVFDARSAGSQSTYAGRLREVRAAWRDDAFRGYLEELPVKPGQVLAVARSIARDLPTREKSRFGGTRSVETLRDALIGWLAIRSEEAAAAEALVELAAIPPYQRELIGRVENWQEPGLRNRILGAVAAASAPDSAVAWEARFEMAKLPDSTARREWKQIFEQYGFVVKAQVPIEDKGTRDVGGELRHCLFEGSTPEVVADLVAWLRDERVPAETKRYIVKAIGDDPAKSENSQLVAAMRERVVDVDESSEVRDEAARLLTGSGKAEVLKDALSEITTPGPWSGKQENLYEVLVEAALPPTDSIAADLEAVFARAPEVTLVECGGICIREAVSAARKADAPQDALLELLGELLNRGDLVSASGWSVPREAWSGIRTLTRQREGMLEDAWVLTALGSDDAKILSEMPLQMTPDQIEAHRERIESLCTHPASSVRTTALFATGRLLDTRAAGILVEALLDPDDGVRLVAQGQLDRLRAYYEEKERWGRIAELGEAGISPLTALLQQARDGNQEVRIAAIHSLGALGDPSALPHLIELLKDSDSRVVDAARKSIDRLVELPKSERD